jgi:hypothetical protein
MRSVITCLLRSIHALARKAQEARTPACRDASEHSESSRPEVRGFSGVSSPQPHRSSDHQSRAVGRCALPLGSRRRPSRGRAESLRIGRHAPFTLFTVREAIKQSLERMPMAELRCSSIVCRTQSLRPFLKVLGLVQSIAVGARRVERYVTVNPWRARVSAGPHRACAPGPYGQLGSPAGWQPSSSMELALESKRPRGARHASHLWGLGGLTISLRLRVRELVGRPSRAADTAQNTWAGSVPPRPRNCTRPHRTATRRSSRG